MSEKYISMEVFNPERVDTEQRQLDVMLFWAWDERWGQRATSLEVEKSLNV